MAISECFSLSKENRIHSTDTSTMPQIDETGLQGSPNFPVAIYLDDVTNNYVNWHWHKEFEIGFVTDGTVNVGCGNRKYRLKTGDIFFINSNVLHSMYNDDSPHNSVFKSITFDGSVIAGDKDSIFYTKYLLPILSNNNLRDYTLRPNDNNYPRLLSLISNIWDAVYSETPDYEIIVRNELSNIFRILIHLPENIIYDHNDNNYNYVQENRVQLILNYIHSHYREKIMLEDLAQVASVSKTEAMRSFRSIIGQSPIKYLKNYKLQNAAYMIRNTNYSIGQICELCGFDDNSYFSKSFKEMYHCTPLAYREKS